MNNRIKIYVIVFYIFALLLLIPFFVFGCSTIKNIIDISDKKTFYGLVVLVNILLMIISILCFISSIVFAYLARKSQKQLKGNKGKGNIIVSCTTIFVLVIL